MQPLETPEGYVDLLLNPDDFGEVLHDPRSSAEVAMHMRRGREALERNRRQYGDGAAIARYLLLIHRTTRPATMSLDEIAAAAGISRNVVRQTRSGLVASMRRNLQR